MPKQPKAKLPPLVVGPRQAAQLLNESHATVYARIHARELPSYKDGGRRKIPVAAIEELIARRLQEANGGGQ